MFIGSCTGLGYQGNRKTAIYQFWLNTMGVNCVGTSKWRAERFSVSPTRDQRWIVDDDIHSDTRVVWSQVFTLCCSINHYFYFCTLLLLHRPLKQPNSHDVTLPIHTQQHTDTSCLFCFWRSSLQYNNSSKQEDRVDSLHLSSYLGFIASASVQTWTGLSKTTGASFVFDWRSVSY